MSRHLSTARSHSLIHTPTPPHTRTSGRMEEGYLREWSQNGSGRVFRGACQFWCGISSPYLEKLLVSLRSIYGNNTHFSLTDIHFHLDESLSRLGITNEYRGYRQTGTACRPLSLPLSLSPSHSLSLSLKLLITMSETHSQPCLWRRPSEITRSVPSGWPQKVRSVTARVW